MPSPSPSGRRSTPVRSKSKPSTVDASIVSNGFATIASSPLRASFPRAASSSPSRGSSAKPIVDWPEWVVPWSDASRSGVASSSMASPRSSPTQLGRWIGVSGPIISDGSRHNEDVVSGPVGAEERLKFGRRLEPDHHGGRIVSDGDPRRSEQHRGLVAGRDRRVGNGDPHPPGRTVPDEPHGVNGLPGGAGGDENAILGVGSAWGGVAGHSTRVRLAMAGEATETEGEGRAEAVPRTVRRAGRRRRGRVSGTPERRSEARVRRTFRRVSSRMSPGDVARRDPMIASADAADF